MPLVAVCAAFFFFFIAPRLLSSSWLGSRRFFSSASCGMWEDAALVEVSKPETTLSALKRGVIMENRLEKSLKET